MPTRGGRKRTDMESRAFKSEIIRLRGEQKSLVEIAKEMGVSKQYVSSVLINAGLGARAEMGEKRRAKMRAKDGNIDATISRLEKQGEYSLASWIGVVAQRRKQRKR
jgi:5-enolpyruvylshikimate-3-phosphate synthase